MIRTFHTNSYDIYIKGSGWGKEAEGKVENFWKEFNMDKQGEKKVCKMIPNWRIYAQIT